MQDIISTERDWFNWKYHKYQYASVYYTLGEYTKGLNYKCNQPVDYTNLVSIEINGTVIPIK